MDQNKRRSCTTAIVSDTCAIRRSNAFHCPLRFALIVCLEFQGISAAQRRQSVAQSQPHPLPKSHGKIQVPSVDSIGMVRKVVGHMTNIPHT
jgi:hypothetical protein